MTAHDPVSAVRDALERHDCRPRGSEQQFMAHCPAHDDRSPSLSVKAADDGRALLHCFAGCLIEDVVAALGMCLHDLFPDSISPRDLTPADRRIATETIGLASLAVNGKHSNGNAPSRRLVLTRVSDVEAEPVTWLWRGRIVLGMLNIVVGEPGLGKSTLVYELAAQLSRGTLDGDLDGTAANVLVVTYEDHVASVVRPRLEAAKADLPRIRTIGVKQEDESEGLLSLPGDLDLVRDAIERTEARLLIVDPIVAGLSGEVNSHRDQDVRGVLAPLAQMAEHYGIAIVCVMHVNKSAAKQFFLRVGGSIGFVGAARSMLLVARDPDDPDGERGCRRIVAHGKCNVGPLAPSLLYVIDQIWLPSEIETSRLSLVGECDTTTSDLLGGGDERLAIDEARDFLEQELADGPRPSEEISRIAGKNGIADRTLKRARNALGVKVKKLGFGSDGRWFLELPDDPSLRGPTTVEHDPVAPFGEVSDLQGKPALDLVPERLRGPCLRNGPLSSDPAACDCVRPDLHGSNWKPHPITGLMVCSTCHPPAMERTA